MPVTDGQVRAEWDRRYAQFREEWRSWYGKQSVTQPQVCCGVPRRYVYGQGFADCRTCGSKFERISAPSPPPSLDELRTEMEAA